MAEIELKKQATPANAAVGYIDTFINLSGDLCTIDENGVVKVIGVSGAFVQKAGDTMTGPLNLPADGLTVNTSDLVVKNGNIGINTANPLHQIHTVLPATNNIYIDGRTNPRQTSLGVFRIDQTPAIPGTRIFNIDIDSNGIGDTRAMLVKYDAGTMLPGKESRLIEVAVDTNAASGGEIAGMSVTKVGLGTSEVVGTEVYAGVVGLIQHSGVEVAAEAAFHYDGSYIDITTALFSPVTNVQLFYSINNYLYIGSATKFDQINCLFTILADGEGILPTFEYSDVSSTWTQFYPTDGTNGFRDNGAILYDIASGLLTWTPSTVNAVANMYWIRIKRTNASLTGFPTEKRIGIAHTTEYSWDTTGNLIVNAITASNQITVAGVPVDTLVHNVIKVNKNPSLGEFSSIAAAVASITGNAFSNQFLISVGPGIYIEPFFTIPHHVAVQGAGWEITQITPDVNTHHTLAMDRSSRLSSISVNGSGSGYASVYIENVDRTIIKDVDFDGNGGGDIGLWIKSTTQALMVTGSNLSFEKCSTAIKVESLGGFATEAVINGFEVFAPIGHTTSNINLYGLGAEVHFLSGFIRGMTTSDIGIQIQNGSYLSCVGVVFEDLNKGIWEDNSGTNAIVELEGLDFDNCNINFQIDSSTTLGHFVGYTDYTKQIVNYASSFFIANKDARIITVAKKGGDFFSIATAVASISGASDTNQYSILVGPGVFTEPLITLPSYVSIIGSGREVTRIVPNANNHHGILISSGFCQVRNLDIEGAGVGYAGLACIDAGAQVNLQDLGFGSNDLGLLVKTTTSIAAFSVTAKHITFDAPYVTAVKVESLAGGYTELIALGFKIEAGPTHTTNNIVIAGTGTECFMVGGFLRGNAGAGTGVLITNGGYFSAVGLVMEDCATGIYADTVGTNPTIELDSIDFDACTINLNIANSTATGRLVGYTDYTKQIINYSSSFFIANKDALLITVAVKGGDFASIAAAVASIADASSTKPYKVLVGAGVFIEPTIVMKPYVTIEGGGDEVTIIQASNPANEVIHAVTKSEIRNCKISGATAAHGIHLESQIGDPNGVFFLRSCLLENNLIHFHCNADIADTQFRVDDCRVIDSDTSNTTFHLESSGGFKCQANITNFLLRDYVAPYPVTFMYMTGVDTQAHVLASTLRANGTGDCFQIRDGAKLSLYGCEIDNWDKGIVVENIGAAPDVDTLALDSDCVTYDLQILHPGTTGHYQGSADQAKITVNASAPYRVSILDKNVTAPFGQVMLGDIGTGATYNKLYNLTKLASKTASMGLLSGGSLSISSGLTLSVSAGNGFCEDSGSNVTEFSWTTQTIAIPASSSRYVYINNSGTLSLSSSLPNLIQGIILGRVTTNATTIEYIERAPGNALHSTNINAKFFRNAFGSIFSSGCAVAESGTRQLNVGSGQYYFAGTEYNPSGGNPVTFNAYYGGTTEVATQTTVDNTQYDNAGTLTALTTLYYAKHALYLVGDGTNESYILVYAQAQYAALISAESAALPLPPTFISDSIVLIASIIVRQGTTNFIEVRDERPIVGFKASAASAATVHGNLLGLSSDDHTQYLLVNGTRAMSGSLDMGTNTIFNAGTYNGVTVQTHASRHLPAGSDPITTAAPTTNLSATSTNATGISNTALSRADHSHAIDSSATSLVSSLVARDANGKSAFKSLALDGATSGSVLITPAAIAGTWTLTLPTSGGAAGYTLQTDGTGITSWVAPSGGINGTGAAGQIAFWTGASAESGDNNLSWDNTNKHFGNGIVAPLYQSHTMLRGDDSIYIDGLTNIRVATFGAIHQDHGAGMPGTKAMYIDVEANGYSDTHAFNIDFTTGAIGLGSESHIIEVNIDGIGASGGCVEAFSVNLINQGSLTCVTALDIGPQVDVLNQITGTYGASNKSWWYDNNISTYTDITTGTFQVLTHNNDIVYIGKTSGTFNSTLINLSIGASANVLPVFTYWNGTAWTAFSPTDGTNGMQQSGTISFNGSLLSGWTATTVNGSTQYWIRIQRTKSGLPTPPTISSIQINAGGVYSWDKNGLIKASGLILDGVPTFSGTTQGSVLFAGPSGVVSQDNTNFFWNDTSKKLSVTSTSTATSGTLTPIQAVGYTNPSGASTTSMRAGIFQAVVQSGNTQNITGNLIGLNGQAQHQGTGTLAAAYGLNFGTYLAPGAGNTSILTNATGIAVAIANQGTVTGAVITSAYGLVVATPSNSTGGTITNTYGVYVAPQASGIQTNTPFGFYQAGATDLNYFAGNTGIGITPTSKFHVWDGSAQTAGYNSVTLAAGATSSTASINKIGVYITDTGAWSGAGSTNTALQVNNTGTGTLNNGLNVSVSGATTNYAATFLGGGVGIGISTPDGLGTGGTRTDLQIHNAGTGTTAFGNLSLSSAATGNTSFMGSISFGSTGLSGADKRTAFIYSAKTDALTVNPVGNLQFYTANGATPTLKMIIDGAGAIGIGAAANTSYGVQISNTTLVGVSQAGLRVAPTFTNASTTSTTGISIATNETGAGTITNAYGIDIARPTGTATFTAVTGILIENSSASSAINYGLRSQISASATNWNLYMEGNAQNYFAGALGIGQSAPTASLHIKAGSTAANSAPLKFTTGTNMTTPEAGAVEFDGTKLYFSPSTTRQQIALTGIGSGLVSSGTRTINAQVGTTYTFVLADGSQTGTAAFVTLANASPITATVPPNSSVAYPIGAQIECSQDGAGKLTIAAGAGVTINSYLGYKSAAGQYVGLTLLKTGTDVWTLLGNLIA